MSPFRTALAVALVLACALPGAAGAVRPGPAVLYGPPVDAPQLQNAGSWEAPPILVSAATAYRVGEWLFQDHLYDDLGAGNAYRYPADPRYAGNAADLVELRLEPRADATAFRLTYNSMVDPNVAATTIGLGDAGAAVAMPHGANAKMPARVFLTVTGLGAVVVDGLTGATLASVPVSVDLPRRQIEATLPYAVFDPRGQRDVRIGAATGLWDAAAAAYVPQTASAFYNVAFRFAEPADVPGGTFRSARQAEALSSGDLSAFFSHVDFAKLATGVSDESGVPGSGFLNRIFPSAVEQRQGRGDATGHTRGCNDPCALQYSGRLQPYALYVPARPEPPGGWPLTIDLHGCGNSHNTGVDSVRQRQLGERGAGSIVLSPLGRGDCYWYFGQAAADVFEAWADVRRRYRLDPAATSIAGISMGGYGALKLAAAYPDLFARVAAAVPCPSAGVQWAPDGVVPGGTASRLVELVRSLRHVPAMSWHSAADTSCAYAGPGRQADVVERLDELGYAYASWTFDGVGHNQMSSLALMQSAPVAEFLGAARVVRAPARVTYALSTLVDEPEHGLDTGHAYWLSGARLREEGRLTGWIDLASHGFGRTTGGWGASQSAPGTLRGGPSGELPYAAETRVAASPQTAPRRDRLDVAARNVGTATIDVKAARLSCSPEIRADLDDGPISLHLDGCQKTYTLKDVCHVTPVFDVVVRAPSRSAVRLEGRRVAVRNRKARLDVRGRPRALATLDVERTDRRGRTHVRTTTHRYCPA